MKKFLYLSAGLALYLSGISNVSAQRPKTEKDTVGVYKNMKNETVYMFKEVDIMQENISYMTGKKGKWDAEKQRNIKWMYIGNRIFLCLPLKKTGHDFQLMEVLAINSKYILVQYWYDWYNYLVFDLQGNTVMEKTKVYDRGATIGAGKNNAKVFEQVKNYFGDCKELIDAMKYNLDDHDLLSHEISLVKCEGAPKLDGIVEALETKYWSKK